MAKGKSRRVAQGRRVEPAKPRAFLSAAEGRVTFYLDAELTRWLRVAAAHRAASASTAVSEAVRQWLARNPPPGYKPPAEDLAAGKDPSPASAVARARELAGKGMTQAAIASALNREGYQTRRRRPWSVVNVGRELRGEVGGGR